MKIQEWSPSMFTVRVQDDAGQWIAYNSMTGAIGSIPREREQSLLPLFREGYKGTPEGAVKDLVDKGFLVPRGTDEKKSAALLKLRRQSARAMHLILMPTEECNFRCVYCYEAFERGGMLPAVREGIKNLAAKTIPRLDRLDVSWFGGEPLEEIGILEELSHFMVGACRANGTAYQANITTNGYHLDPDNLRKLLACEVRTIQVTLDGFGRQHDARRVLKGGGGTFERIWENLREIRKVPGDFQLRLRINFNQETLAGLDQLLAMISTEFAGDKRFSVFFRPVGYWGGPNDGKFSICDAAPGETATFESARAAVKAGIPVSMTFPFFQPNGAVCYAAQPTSFVIGADGTIYKCTVALDKDINKVGRLLPTGEMDIDQDRFALWVTSDDSEDTVCQSCAFRPACQGAACPLVRIETGKRPCPPEKTRIKRALVSVWEHYQRFGKPDPGGSSLTAAAMD